MTTDILEMSTQLVTAHLTQNRMSAKDVPDFIRNVYTTLDDLKSKTASVEANVEAPALANTAKTDAVEQKAESAPRAENAPAPAETTAANEAEADTAPRVDQPHSNKVAYVRDNDLSDPVFEGLDPYLAARISPRTAEKLDPNNEIHPSVFPDHLICLEDGQSVTLLRSYIKKRFGLTPTEYVEKWNLPDEYPMSPPEYIAKKRKAALKGGLGRKVRANREKPKAQKASEEKTASKTAPKATRGRPKKAKTADKSDAASASARDSSTPARRKLSLFQKESQPA